MIQNNSRKYEELNLNWEKVFEVRGTDFIKKYNINTVVLSISGIVYDTDGECIYNLQKKMKVEFDLSDYDDNEDLTIQDIVDNECADIISDTTGWLVEDYIISKVYLSPL